MNFANPHQLSWSLISSKVAGMIDETAIFEVLDPRAHLRTFLKQGVRADGRELLKSRNLEVNMDKKGQKVPGTFGTAEVRLGKTLVRCDISVMIGTPSVAAPDEGDLDVDVCLNAMCGAKYENLRNKHEDALDLETLLLSVFVSGKVLDLKDLCIESRKHAFRLCVGVTILNHDGNLPDACILVVMMALVNFRKPDVHPQQEANPASQSGRGRSRVPLCISQIGNPDKKLGLAGIVLPSTVAFFLDEEKDYSASSAALLADPSRTEEGCVSGTLTVATLLPLSSMSSISTLPASAGSLCGVFSNESEGLGSRDAQAVGGTSRDYVNPSPGADGDLVKTAVEICRKIAIEQLAPVIGPLL